MQCEDPILIKQANKINKLRLRRVKCTPELINVTLEAPYQDPFLNPSLEIDNYYPALKDSEQQTPYSLYKASSIDACEQPSKLPKKKLRISIKKRQKAKSVYHSRTPTMEPRKKNIIIPYKKISQFYTHIMCKMKKEAKNKKATENTEQCYSKLIKYIDAQKEIANCSVCEVKEMKSYEQSTSPLNLFKSTPQNYECFHSKRFAKNPRFAIITRRKDKNDNSLKIDTFNLDVLPPLQNIKINNCIPNTTRVQSQRIQLPYINMTSSENAKTVKNRANLLNFNEIITEKPVIEIEKNSRKSTSISHKSTTKRNNNASLSISIGDGIKQFNMASPFKPSLSKIRIKEFRKYKKSKAAINSIRMPESIFHGDMRLLEESESSSLKKRSLLKDIVFDLTKAADITHY